MYVAKGRVPGKKTVLIGGGGGDVLRQRAGSNVTAPAGQAAFEDLISHHGESLNPIITPVDREGGSTQTFDALVQELAQVRERFAAGLAENDPDTSHLRSIRARIEALEALIGPAGAGASAVRPPRPRPPLHRPAAAATKGSSLRDQIAAVLATNPCLSAREVVRCLRRAGVQASKSEVNGVLYRGHRFVKDDAAVPRWRLS